MSINYFSFNFNSLYKTLRKLKLIQNITQDNTKIIIKITKTTTASSFGNHPKSQLVRSSSIKWFFQFGGPMTETKQKLITQKLTELNSIQKELNINLEFLVH